MSSGEAFRVCVEFKGVRYDFLHVEPRTNDNSILFTVLAGPDTKVRRLSYHPTGAVRHHNLAPTGLQYFEPLSGITRPNVFLWLTLNEPEMRRAPNSIDEQTRVATLGLETLPRLIGFALTPPNVEPAAVGIGVPRPGFDIWVFDAAEPREEHREGTWALAPCPLFGSQVLSEEEAEIAYMRLLYPTEGHVVVPPNGENFLTFYFDVKLSRIPDVEIKGGRPGIKAEVHRSSERHKVKVRLSDKHGTLRGDGLSSMDGQFFFNARLRDGRSE